MAKKATPSKNFSIFNLQTMSQKQKIKMEVGKRYKGYGVLNEYGEYMELTT